jgi:uncharacterized membrane protein (UPF0127 family)
MAALDGSAMLTVKPSSKGSWPVPILGLIFLLLACAPASQAELPIANLTIGGHALQAELAVRPREQQKGLMFRESLPNNRGMLFVFGEPRQASFWMKNTSIPLSIAYLGKDGTILEIYDLQPFNEDPVPSVSRDVWFALEVNRGWFSARHIKPGVRVEGIPSIR